MAFSMKNSCQNRPQIIQKVSSSRAVKAFPVRHVQPKRTVSAVQAFMENKTSEVAASASLKISMRLSLGYGESLKLVGASPEFGSWNLDVAPEMTWNEGDVWTATLDLPAGFSSEYKFVHCIPGQEPIWEFSENRFVAISQSATGPVSLETAWCEPTTTFGEVQNVYTDAAAVASEAQIDTEFSPQEGLVTPAFQSAVDSVAAFFNGAATTEEEKIADGSEDVAALEAAFEADAALKEQEETIAAIPEVTDVLETAVEGEDAVAADLAKPATEGNSMFENAAKTAGALALGVAGAALLSAVAIDVADTAIIGAVAAAAGGAVLSGSGSSTKASRKSSTITEDGEEVFETEVEAVSSERNIKGAGETGVIIGAGLLAAFDAGRAMVDSMTTASSSAIEEEESTKMDQE